MTEQEEMSPEERALSFIEGKADEWAAEVRLYEMIKNAMSVARLNASVPADVREQFIARAEAHVDAIVKQAWIEAAYRGFCEGVDAERSRAALTKDCP
jgi:phage terminase Nu1 subunit (DNA packaging protein)